MTIAKHETGSALAIRDDQTGFTPAQIATLRQLGVENATDGDLAVFFHQAQRTGLDPFARQVYMVGRNTKDKSGQWVTKYTIQTGIDGFRLIGRRAADAKHETLEVTDTEWCGPDGKWVDVWLSDQPPAAARVAIIRNGGRFPAVALFREYAQYRKDRDGSQTLTQMWADKGALMLAKCAEALAWRKAYPQDLSGLYTSDEMGQADNHAPARMSVSQAPMGAAALRDSLAKAADQADLTVDVDTGEIVDAEPVVTLSDVEACATTDELNELWPLTHDPAIREAMSARAAAIKASAPVRDARDES